MCDAHGMSIILVCALLAVTISRDRSVNAQAVAHVGCIYLFAAALVLALRSLEAHKCNIAGAPSWFCD